MLQVLQIKPYLWMAIGSKCSHMVILRKDNTYWCDCCSFKYNGQTCKHITEVKQNIGITEVV